MRGGGAHGRIEEKLMDASFSIRKPVSKKAQIRLKPSFGSHRIMSGRIERVVNRDTFSSPIRTITTDNGPSAAVSKDKIVLPDQTGKRIVWISFQPVQSSRGINIPES